jgi:hypothetical protein
MHNEDDFEDRQGISVQEVLSVGTAENGMAFVECQFREEPAPALILFPQEVAQIFARAVLEAASRLDPGHSLKGTTVGTVPLRDARLYLAEDTARTGRMVLVLTTMAGARLAFELPERTMDQLIDGVWEAMQKTGQLDGLN